ncbi:AI-2E family transporter [Maribacter sp. 2307ULW6-5]
MKKIPPSIIRQLFVLLLIIMMGSLILQEMVIYLGGVLGAITLYVILQKAMGKLTNKGWSKPLAAGSLMFASFVGILLPLVGLGFLMGSKVSFVVNNSERFLKALEGQLTQLETFIGYELTITDVDTSSISSWLTNSLQSFAGSTFNVMLSITLMYFLLYFMLMNRKEMVTSLFEYVPLKDKNLQTLGRETRSKVLANALGIPSVALAQGVVALIGFFIFGIADPFFWAAIVTIGSMVPFVGSALGTIPVFILALGNGDTFQAWGILIYGTLAIGATDNIFRLYFLKRLEDVHPLITLTGVLVGVPLFGFIGLIFGPLLVSLFLIIIKIYKDEYGTSKEKL